MFLNGCCGTVGSNLFLYGCLEESSFTNCSVCSSFLLETMILDWILWYSECSCLRTRRSNISDFVYFIPDVSMSIDFAGMFYVDDKLITLIVAMDIAVFCWDKLCIPPFSTIGSEEFSVVSTVFHWDEG